MPTPLRTELAAFCKSHWPHLVLLVPAAVLVTVIHEAAHAGAVIAQGGTVTEFIYLPTGNNWGQIQYTFPSGMQYSSVAISLAPYALWAGLAATAALLSARRRAYAFWAASAILVWMFLAPLADIANAVAGYLPGKDNDLFHALGPPTPGIWAIWAALAGGAAIAGFFVQTRLYRTRALSARAYVVLCALLAGIVACTVCLPIP